MPEENVMTEETMVEEPTNEVDEQAVINQIVDMIASLSAEAQRALMTFLNQELWSVVSEEEEEYRNSPEEQQRRADVMSDAM